MARLRTFLAVDLGKPIRDRVIALQESLARTGVEVKWVEPENLHVTLLFLGEVEDRAVPEVCRVVQEVAGRHAPFPMSVESAGCFPNARRPRILWVGVGEGVQPLCALHDELEGPLQDLGYRREERRYTPHITLGRVKSDRPTADLAAALAKRADWKAGETTVREVLVMSSELTPQGRRPFFRFPAAEARYNGGVRLCRSSCLFEAPMPDSSPVPQAGNDGRSPAERRASVRHHCNLDILCQPAEADEQEERWPATVCDISVEGLGVLVREPFAPGTIIGVELQSPDETLEYTLFARVMHVQALPDGRWRAGCAFTRKLSEEELRSLL